MKYGLCGHKATFGHDLDATVVKTSAKAEMKYKNKQDKIYICKFLYRGTMCVHVCVFTL